MRIRSKIIIIFFLLSSCKSDNINPIVKDNVDSLLIQSSTTTQEFSVAIEKANKAEDQMWNNVSNKMDSLTERTQELEKKLDGRPKVVRPDGSIKLLTPIEKIKAYQDSTGRNKMR